MRVIVFAGPSLPEADRPKSGGIAWRPPAEAGDLLRLELRRGLTVCLIDGYFDHRPAVRHKEILLALSEGVRVIGASSIGALRAAEMESFGMVGVGAIFRAYARGRICGDDEVALVHGPAEWGWRPLSVPLVEVRATLCRAVRRGRASAAEARLALAAARRVHYSERGWDAVVAALPLARREALRAALASGHVEQKRVDAAAALAEALKAGPGRPELGPGRPELPRMVSTSFLRALARECGVALPPTRRRAG